MYINNFQIKIKYKFKLYHYIICDEQNILYQLQHFSNATKRTYALRKLIYNEQRKAYRYKGSWIKKETLQKLKYKPS